MQLSVIDYRRRARLSECLDEPCSRAVLRACHRSGDGLRRMEKWAHKRNILVRLTGVDLNADRAEFAEEATSALSSIQWISSDVFSFRDPNPVHIVVSLLFKHHLDDAEIVRFLRWMEDSATLGWVVNDLSRNAVPYCLFRWFSKVAALHPFVQHDGPVSIARAFVPEDCKRLCAASR
jgi:hypothetical protein